MTACCVIASTRPWNRDMAQRLAARTGRPFEAITDPAALTPQHLAALQPRYVFFPHWSHLIPAAVFEAHECVVFHMTDLPYGRGGSPLQNLIVRGHTDTVVTALRCVAELDAGPVYLRKPLPLHGSAGEIYRRAALVIEDMIAEIVRDQPAPQPQVGEPVRFQRRTPAQSDLAGATSLAQAYDHIRMLDAEGYPHAFVQVGALRIEFTRAALAGEQLQAEARITIVTGPEAAAGKDKP